MWSKERKIGREEGRKERGKRGKEGDRERVGD